MNENNGKLAKSTVLVICNLYTGTANALALFALCVQHFNLPACLRRKRLQKARFLSFGLAMRSLAIVRPTRGRRLPANSRRIFDEGLFGFELKAIKAMQPFRN